MNKQQHILYIQLLADASGLYNDPTLIQIENEFTKCAIFNIDNHSDNTMLKLAERFCAESHKALIVVNSFDAAASISGLSGLFMKLKRNTDIKSLGLILLGRHPFYEKLQKLLPNSRSVEPIDLSKTMTEFLN